MLLKNYVVVLFAFVALAASAQKNDSVHYPTFKIDGTIKNKFEIAAETGMSRFSVRNSRVGMRGKFTDVLLYRVQLELSDNGDFKVLDLCGTVEPIRGLKISLGQTSIPLFNSYITSPSTNMFANRTFLGKYYLSSRDIGFHIDYDFHIAALPASIELGVYNGNVINNPVWRKKLSYGGRFELGTMKGWRTTFKYYDYPNLPKVHHVFYGMDVRYEVKNWKVETEIMRRNNTNNRNEDLLSYYVQGAYAFDCPKGKVFKKIIPAVRWDAIDKHSSELGFDVNRFTTGLGFGFTQKNFSSLLRLDYEWYFVDKKLDILSAYEEMDSNKFTIELLLTF